jgi:hypothetical protein
VEGQVGAPPEAAVVAQLAEELLYRTEPLFYHVDLALTIVLLVMLGVPWEEGLCLLRTWPGLRHMDSGWE